jgi:hypothetical protein
MATKIGTKKRTNHGKRDLPAWKRIGDREQTRITVRQFEGYVAQLAKEHEALKEQHERFIDAFNALVATRNSDNQRINMVITQNAVLKRVLLEIGHTHSAILGRTVDFDEEAFTRMLEIVIREKAEEAAALRADLEAKATRARHVACQWCTGDSIDDGFPVARCTFDACGALTPTDAGEALRLGILPEWPDLLQQTPPAEGEEADAVA